ncbi:MAG: hypothetical protein E6J58_03840 [Deltaproteobacteria bacterium]|nr:MAG: hypothetical protein E6J67_01295 [Deltaproteobacteria bacterium]TMB40848.1 MAG: hypothetical protein E6J58_03840 [Deltaproteobacteria bacterium]
MRRAGNRPDPHCAPARVRRAILPARPAAPQDPTWQSLPRVRPPPPARWRRAARRRTDPLPTIRRWRCPRRRPARSAYAWQRATGRSKAADARAA